MKRTNGFKQNDFNAAVKTLSRESKSAKTNRRTAAGRKTQVLRKELNPFTERKNDEFGVFAAQWYERQRISVKRRTLIRYREILNSHILPYFGKMPITQINEKHTAAFQAFLYERGNVRTGKGLSNNSVSQIIGILKRVFNSAMNSGFLKINPASGLICKGGERKIEALTEDEQIRLERYINSGQKPGLYGIQIALYTGLRIGELLALKWKNVDMKRRRIFVCETKSPVKISDGSEPYIGTPKTDAGCRMVPFPRALIPYFSELKLRGGEYVICKQDGSGVMVGSYQRIFHRALEALDIRRRGFHCLRHTYATRAIENGADLRTLSEILGHSDPAVTLRRYAHSTDKQKEKIAEKIGGRIKDAPVLSKRITDRNPRHIN